MNDLYELENIISEHENQEITVRARLEQIRGKKKICFLVLRDRGVTIQVFMHKSNITEEEFRMANSCSLESLVLVTGKVVKANVKSCTIQKHELSCVKFTILNRAKITGFQVNRDFIHPNPELCYDMRYLDLRDQTNQRIFIVKSKISQYCQEYLWAKDFIQIQTPKIISTASEGGAEVFKLGYFNKDAYLAQSPQLYKQMAINSEIPRVYEIGPVFRAENSNSIRHLTEFTGIDMEMRIKDDYHEVIRHLWNMMTFVIDKLITNDIKGDFSFAYTKSPLIIEYPKAIKMLQESGEEIEDDASISGTQEKKLGDLVKQKYNSDMFVLDKFPLALRPYYTQPSDEKYSNSYDIIIRGMEVLSGAQRIHDPELLMKRALACGVDPDKITHYIESFRYGSYPHGGGGFGLERLTMNILGLQNIRKTSLFYRDPKRLEP